MIPHTFGAQLLGNDLGSKSQSISIQPKKTSMMHIHESRHLLGVGKQLSMETDLENSKYAPKNFKREMPRQLLDEVQSHESEEADS